MPSNARLLIGDVGETVPAFLDQLKPGSPIGFVAIDVDYYSSAAACLKLFDGADPSCYLYTTLVYLDDVQFLGHSIWAGEMLAVDEFNARNELRKLGPANFLREWRLFKKASWISQIYCLHVFDHPARFRLRSDKARAVLKNVYLD